MMMLHGLFTCLVVWIAEVERTTAVFWFFITSLAAELVAEGTERDLRPAAELVAEGTERVLRPSRSVRVLKAIL